MARLNLDNPVRPLVCVDLNGVLDVVIFTTRHPTGVRRWLP
jgi:hypothetical protein